MIAVSVFAGYMTEIDIDGRTAYKLVDDDPDFLHLRLKAEVDWEKQRKSDNSNPALIVPVRIRDGDACRWCGDVVNWQSRTGGRNGTYDHLEPGQPATIDTYVVACGSCNSSRGDGTKAAGQRQLLPAPSVPYFSQYSSEWIRDNKWAQNNAYDPPAPSRKKVRPGTPAPHCGHHDAPEPRHGGEHGTSRRATRQPVGDRGHARSHRRSCTANRPQVGERTVEHANRQPVGERTGTGIDQHGQPA